MAKRRVKKPIYTLAPGTVFYTTDPYTEYTRLCEIQNQPGRYAAWNSHDKTMHAFYGCTKVSVVFVTAQPILLELTKK